MAQSLQHSFSRPSNVERVHCLASCLYYIIISVSSLYSLETNQLQ